MYYVYILQNLRDKTLYTGFTVNLKKRFFEHEHNKNFSTKNRGSYKIIYFEGCINRKDALKRERYLKTSWGKRYIKNRLKSYLTG